MLLNAMNLGACGVEQLFCAGKVSFDTEGIEKGVDLVELKGNYIVTKAAAVVKTAFNAGTTNVLTVGVNNGADDLLGSEDVTEGTIGENGKTMFKMCNDGALKVRAKFTSTGTAATAGEAEIYIGLVRIPE